MVAPFDLSCRFLCLTMAWIPGVLALTDCVMGLASGMTIKFFPIFFKDKVKIDKGVSTRCTTAGIILLPLITAWTTIELTVRGDRLYCRLCFHCP